jgi:hypothetical protein
MNTHLQPEASVFIEPLDGSRVRRTLGKSVGILVIAIWSQFLSGCGLSINTNAGISGNQDTSGNTGGSVGQVVAVPGYFQALTGCSNPNTGISNGDWGVGPNPVYTNPWGVTVGTPVYKSNTIFWTSREAAPGQSVLLTGAFTDAVKTARVAFIPPGTTDWQSIVHGSTTIAPTNEQGTTGLSFIVPLGFPSGIYGFEIDDPSASPVLGLANVPALNWAIGVPSVTDASAALKHEVYDCGVELGGILRLFGKNFTASNLVILQSSSGVAYSLAISKLDSNSVAAQVPSTLHPGTYNVWVGTSPWSATSSPAAQINLYASRSLAVETFDCPLVGDGQTDNTKRLQSCLDRFAPSAPGKEVAYIEIPAGNFVISGQLSGHSGEVLAGKSPISTNFIGQPEGSPPLTWFYAPQYFGMTNLSLTAPPDIFLLVSAGAETGNPVSSGHLFFNSVRFASTVAPANNSEMMFSVAGPDIQVYNSYFLSNENQDFDLYFGDGAIVSGNHFVLNNWTGNLVEDSQNVIFENNSTDSSQVIGQGPGGTSGGSGLSISRGNDAGGPSALSRDIYIGYNNFNNTGSNSQQVVLNDGDGGSYYGPISSSTANTVTLAYDPWWYWMGTTNPQAASMAIVSGTGVGQYSFLQSFSGRTVTLATPWKVQPDGTSIVVISQYEQNMTWAHNTMTNTLGASFVLADALEGVIEDNTLNNSGAGVLISAFGPYGGPASYGPVINTDVLRNTIAVGAGNDIWQSVAPNNYVGIGVQDMPGCLVSGLMIRDNVLPPINNVYDTDGVNGISAVVVEQNQAYWAPPFYPTVGFLIQDNSPPAP